MSVTEDGVREAKRQAGRDEAFTANHCTGKHSTSKHCKHCIGKQCTSKHCTGTAQGSTAKERRICKTHRFKQQNPIEFSKLI